MEKERLDFNANATPQYLINQQNVLPVKHDSSGIDSNFSTTSQQALLILKGRPIINLLNYIPNLPEPTVPYSGDGPDAPGGGSTGGTGVTDGAGSTGGATDVEEKAIDAAEDILNEAQELEDALQEGDWVITDPATGYEYIDPQFYVEYQKLMSLLNLLQIIGMIIDAVQGLKKNIIESFSGRGGSGDDASASEILSMARETGLVRGQSQLLEMTEEVNIWNQELFTRKKTDALESGSAGWYDYFSEIVTFGGSDSVSRREDAEGADAVYAVTEEYENFQKGVEAKYEGVLSNSGLFQDGLSDIGDAFDTLTWGNLAVDIDGGQADVDRDKLLAAQMFISGRENYRRLIVMIESAIQDLKSLVIEGTTGLKVSTSAKRVLAGVLEGLEKFEQMIFRAVTSQIQMAMAAQNQRVDAYNDKEMRWDRYYSSAGGAPFGFTTWGALFSGDWDAFAASLLPLGGSTPLVGGLTKNISDWIFLEAYNARIDDATNPSQLDMNRVYTILADLFGTSVEQIREQLNSKDKNAQKLNELEQREWEILGRLSEANVVYTADDGTKGIYESRVNALRERLTGLQNTERLIVMLVDAIARLNRIVVKLTTDLGDIESGKEAREALNVNFESRQLAFDLKFAGIKNKVEAQNKELEEKKQLEKARVAAAGSLVGVAAAVVILAVGVAGMVVTGPFSLIAAIGAVAALGQLGAAIGSIVWNALNPIDDKIYDKTDFYDQLEDQIEDRYNDQIDRLNENSHINAEESSDPLSAGNQWAKDTRLFISVRDQLTKVYIYEQIMLMYVKALADLKSSASLTGISGDFADARSASSSRYQQKSKALELKNDMVEDIISRRNLAVDQKTELNWAILNAVISAVQIICSGVTAGLASAAEEMVAGAAKEAAIASVETAKDVSFGVQLGASAVQIAKNVLDATSGYGELGEYQKIVAMIEAVVKGADYLDAGSRQILRGALAGVNEAEMLDSVGKGKVAVDASKYYQGMRAIQRMYNRIILMLRVAEAVAQVKARIVGAPTVSGASEAFSAAKDSHLKQIDLLYERVQTYVQRSNAMADAWRQLAVSVVMAAYKILMKVADKFDAIDNLKEKLHKALGTDKAKVQLVKSDAAARKVSQLVTGEKLPWDGSIGASDLVDLVIDFTLSPQFITLLTQAIYDAGKDGEHRSGRVVREEKTGKSIQALSSSGDEGADATGARLDQLKNKSYDSQLALAALGVEADKLGIDRELQRVMFDFLTETIDSSVKSIFDDKKKENLPVIKQGDEADKNQVAAPVGRAVLSRADSIVAADQVASISDPKLRTRELDKLKKQVTSGDPAVMSHALETLAQLSARRPQLISKSELEGLISNLGSKVLKDYADLARLNSAQKPAPKAGEVPAAKGKQPSKRGELIRLVHSRAIKMLDIANDPDPKRSVDDKRKAVADMFGELKVAIKKLIKQDATIVGIDTRKDPQKLADRLKAIDTASEEELAKWLEELQKDPSFTKSLTKVQSDFLKDSIKNLRDIQKPLEVAQLVEEVRASMRGGLDVTTAVASRKDLQNKPALQDLITRKIESQKHRAGGVVVDGADSPLVFARVAAVAQAGNGSQGGGSFTDDDPDQRQQKRGVAYDWQATQDRALAGTGVKGVIG